MIPVHHGGKMGDLIYALPVLRALARQKNDKIALTTSALCWQIVPLLWEQPYFASVELDDAHTYHITNCVMSNWEYFKSGEGLNLSLQPCMKDMADQTWTHIYMKLCGVEELQAQDCLALPSLVNHRRWHYGLTVTYDGQVQSIGKQIVIAPEVETLESAPMDVWVKIINESLETHPVVLIGRNTTVDFVQGVQAWRAEPISKWPNRIIDLRGQTTVSTMARIIAESSGFIGAHSFPWHLARHSEVPAVCVQKWLDGLYRCRVIDTPSMWVEPEAWRQAVQFVTTGLPQEQGRTR